MFTSRYWCRNPILGTGAQARKDIRVHLQEQYANEMTAELDRMFLERVKAIAHTGLQQYRII